MELGAILLQGATGGALATLVATALVRSRAGAGPPRALTAALALTTLALTLALIVLVVKFLRVDTSTFYVWRYTHAEHPWYYRMSGVWGGQAGTLLLWSWYVSIGALALRLARRRSRPSESGSSAHLVAVAVLAVFLAVLTLLASQQALFAPTSDYRVQEMRMGESAMREFVYAPGSPGVDPASVIPQGFGLNPLLLTPFMVIHPWIEFAAYGLATALFALVLGYIHSPQRRDFDDIRKVARFTWIVYTTAIALGALWAYYTLSFGGYWAWDPVETANLLPWLALTGFLHVAGPHKRHDDAARLAPLLAASVFILTLLATFLTRSGVWNGSVHAFITDGDLNVQDAGARLLSIMRAEPGVAQLTSLLLAAPLITSLLMLRAELHARGSRAHRRALHGFLALHGLLLAWVAVAPTHLVETTIRLSRALSSGNYAIALSILVAATFATPFAYLYVSSNATGARRPALDQRRTLLAASILFALSTIVLLILLLRGINGTQRVVFDERAPILAIGFSALITLHYVRSAHGSRVATGALGAAAAAGALAALMLPGARLLAMTAALVVGALLALLWGLDRLHARHGVLLQRRLAHHAFLAAGVLGLLEWTSPPRSIGLANVEFAVTPTIMVLGLAATCASFLAAHAALRPATRPLALAAGLLAIGSFGYLAGTAFALLGVALAATATRKADAASKLRTDVHRASIHVIHIAVVLTMLGYGMSTYFAEDYAFTQDEPLELGVPAPLGAYAITFTSSDGVDGNADGVYENVDAHLAIERNGRPAGDAVLSMFFVPSKDHYDPSTFVDRRAREDLYFNANFRSAHAMYSDTDGWTVGHGPTTEIRSDDITKLALHIRILPYVNVLWAGISLGILAMVARVVTRPKGTTERLAPAAQGEPDAATA